MHAKAASRLLHHYRENARALPWRAPPGTPRQDPYRVWLSEVMLQQTTVATVTPRFLRFVERWPTINALAAATDAEILAEWAGLGYYARARNLIACARAVVGLGAFPTGEAELRQLPGLGSYTAAAVAAIAFGQDAVPVDTNVERVVARVFGLADRAEVRRAASAWWPKGQAGDFAQACMDLGATICRPKAPACFTCPLRDCCRAALIGTPEAFPALKAKKERPYRYGLAWWIRRGGELWLTRRPASGLLGGMAALPGPDWTDLRPTANPLAVHRHGFTHFTLDLLVVPRAEPVGDGWWQPIESLAKAGLPTLYRRAVEAAMHAEREPRLAA